VCERVCVCVLGICLASGLFYGVARHDQLHIYTHMHTNTHTTGQLPHHASGRGHGDTGLPQEAGRRVAGSCKEAALPPGPGP
jgi:hypothetical protein